MANMISQLLSMKRNCIQTILPVAISFFILVFPFYPFCSYFAEANPFFTDLGFENPDRDDQLFGHQQDGSRAFALTFFLFRFIPKVHVFERSLYRSSQPPSVNQENLTLRCWTFLFASPYVFNLEFSKISWLSIFFSATQKGGKKHV